MLDTLVGKENRVLPQSSLSTELEGEIKKMINTSEILWDGLQLLSSLYISHLCIFWLIHMRALVVLPKKKAGLIREGRCFVYKLRGKTQERKEEKDTTSIPERNHF